MPLPDLVLFNDYGGDWDAYLDALFNIYMADIVRGAPILDGLPVRYRRHPESKGKGAGFWHVISEGPSEDDRLPDLRRCERIRWIRYAIDNVGNEETIDLWKNTRGRETNTLLWVEEEFLIILAERNGYHLLRTAFCTERTHRITSLRKERDAWLAGQRG